MSNVLIVEDEARIASFLQKGLRANGFATTIVNDGNAALLEASSGVFDIVLLDLGLPGRDGFSVLSELRRRGSMVPVIVLTARRGIDDTVAGLEGGADDYIAKPFRFEELLARVRLRLRGDRVPDTQVLRCGSLTLDLRTRVVSTNGTKYDLSTREFALAEFLLRHPNQVLSREQLLSRVWGYDYDPGSNVVDVYIRYLRKKIGAARIETVRGAGYRLVAV
jgi:DNA-binding response OmpR family regulator